MNCSVYNNAAGGTYQQVQTYWREDHERIKEFLSTLDYPLGTLTWTAGSTWSGICLIIRIIRSGADYAPGQIIPFGPLIDSPQGEMFLSASTARPSC